MTRVQFYHNTEDPLALACELVERAVSGGRKVVLRLPDVTAANRLDHMLWSFDPLAFIPHVMAGSPLAPETPVIITHGGDTAHDAAADHDDLLFNLGPASPPEFERYRMLIEIVGLDEGERQAARQRWMHYKSCGLPIQAFDSQRREAI